MIGRLARASIGLFCGVSLLLSGCASTPGSPQDQVQDSPFLADVNTVTEPTALGLVDIWRVSGAAGEEADTWLRLDAPNFEVWRDCGMIFGDWRATDSLFVASVWGASGSCASGGMPQLDWLESVTGYRATAIGWALTDASGSAVATLTIGGRPDPIPTAVESFTEPPPITAAVRAAVQKPAALPDGSVPATTETLLGRWVPTSFEGYTDPHVLFDADGSWSGSDGCNGNGGRWAADGSGTVLATAGMSTAMGCEGALVPSWVGGARLAVIDGDELRLLDADGSELGRLERD